MNSPMNQDKWFSKQKKYCFAYLNAGGKRHLTNNFCLSIKIQITLFNCTS